MRIKEIDILHCVLHSVENCAVLNALRRSMLPALTDRTFIKTNRLVLSLLECSLFSRRRNITRRVLFPIN